MAKGIGIEPSSGRPWKGEARCGLILSSPMRRPSSSDGELAVVALLAGAKAPQHREPRVALHLAAHRRALGRHERRHVGDAPAALQPPGDLAVAEIREQVLLVERRRYGRHARRAASWRCPGVERHVVRARGLDAVPLGVVLSVLLEVALEGVLPAVHELVVGDHVPERRVAADEAVEVRHRPGEVRLGAQRADHRILRIERRAGVEAHVAVGQHLVPAAVALTPGTLPSDRATLWPRRT